MIEIGKNIRIGVSEFKGKKYIGIRKYYKSESGEMKPGKNGISMSENDWREFTEKFDDIKSDIDKELK